MDLEQLSLAKAGGEGLSRVRPATQTIWTAPKTNSRASAAVMQKLRIYLDTSVVNFLFAEDAPDFRRVREEFFAEHARKYELFTS